jgi:hypothetical protein
MAQWFDQLRVFWQNQSSASDFNGFNGYQLPVIETKVFPLHFQFQLFVNILKHPFLSGENGRVIQDLSFKLVVRPCEKWMGSLSIMEPGLISKLSIVF